MGLLHITEKMTGKMEGMMSLSTSCKTNPFCLKHQQIEGSICKKCYADRQMNMYTRMSPCLERNAEILTVDVIPMEYLPVINAAFFRFEAFGDIINSIQVENYFNICKKNPYTKFALWTKNPDLIAPVADKKPNNLIIVLSSLMLNKQVNKDKYPFVDKVFTVYDAKTIKEKGIDINCGAHKCIECLRCYTDGETVINEKLK